MKKIFTGLILILCAVPLFAEKLQKVKIYEQVDPAKGMTKKRAEMSLKAELPSMIAQRGMVYHITKKSTSQNKEVLITGSQKDVNTHTKYPRQDTLMGGKIICVEKQWVVQPWQKVPGFEDLPEEELVISFKLKDVRSSISSELMRRKTRVIQEYLEKVIMDKKGEVPSSYKGRVLITDIPVMELDTAKKKIIYKMKVKAIID